MSAVLETRSTVMRACELAEHIESLSAVRILDVRTPGEFESAHIRGAYNIPLDTLTKRCHELGELTNTVVIVCQTGSRAAQAVKILKDSGIPKVHLLDGGINAWMEAYQPIVEGRKRLSLERQVRIVAGALAASGGLFALLVNPLFALIPAVIGTGLVFAGITDFCGMALLLAKLPYNRASRFDSEEMVTALKSGCPSPAAQESAL